MPRRSLGTEAPRKSHHIRKRKTTGRVYIVVENINIIIIQYRYTKPVAPVPVVVSILYIFIISGEYEDGVTTSYKVIHLSV